MISGSNLHRGPARARPEAQMFDPKRLLDQLLGSKIPGTGATVRDKAGQAGQLAKDNPLATGALAAMLYFTSNPANSGMDSR